MQNIEIYNCDDYLIDCNTIKNVAKSVLSIFGIDKYSLEINFVSVSEIHDLNKKHRQIDRPTDVLSFPQISAPGEEIRILGNLVISPEICKEKNEDLIQVVKHGLLHLLGYDHEEDLDKWETAAKQIDCNF